MKYHVFRDTGKAIVTVAYVMDLGFDKRVFMYYMGVIGCNIEVFN